MSQSPQQHNNSADPLTIVLNSAVDEKYTAMVQAVMAQNAPEERLHAMLDGIKKPKAETVQATLKRFQEFSAQIDQESNVLAHRIPKTMADDLAQRTRRLALATTAHRLKLVCHKLEEVVVDEDIASVPSLLKDVD